jgi:transposase-like protein
MHDRAGGSSSTVSIVYPKARVQRSVFHKISNLAVNLRNFAHGKAILKDASDIYKADSLLELRKNLRRVHAKWSPLNLKAVKNFLADFELTGTHWDHPPHRSEL